MQLLRKIRVNTPEGECDLITVRIDPNEERDFMLNTIVFLEPVILNVEEGTELGEYALLFRGKREQYRDRIERLWPELAAVIYK